MINKRTEIYLLYTMGCESSYLTNQYAWSLDGENQFSSLSFGGAIPLSTSTEDMASYLLQCHAPSLEVSLQML